jgi:hypothetical protein
MQAIRDNRERSTTSHELESCNDYSMIPYFGIEPFEIEMRRHQESLEVQSGRGHGGRSETGSRELFVPAVSTTTAAAKMEFDPDVWINKIGH